MSPETAVEAIAAQANGKGLRPASRIEVISPKKAERILEENNVRNRELRESRVATLAAAIKRGEWKLTGDAIVFDVDGVLLNGQHRLAACVVAGMPIEVLVLRNLPAESQDVMDNTLSRRLGDALTLRGEVNVHRLAAGINWYARMVRAEATGNVHPSTEALRPSIPMLLQLFDENQGLRDGVREQSPLYQSGLRLRAGAAIGLWYRLHLIDADDNRIFWDQVRTGANLPEDSPILALRRLSQAERRSTRDRQPDFRWVAMAIKAWNFWREGRSAKVLTWHGGGGKPEAWPEPI